MSARRDARAAAVEQLPGDGGPPRELLSANHRVWRDGKRYRDFLRRHGLDATAMPASERMGCDASPGNRRNSAAAAWARLSGVTTGDVPGRPGMPDWKRLRLMGLVG